MPGLVKMLQQDYEQVYRSFYFKFFKYYCSIFLEMLFHIQHRNFRALQISKTRMRIYKSLIRAEYGFLYLCFQNRLQFHACNVGATHTHPGELIIQRHSLKLISSLHHPKSSHRHCQNETCSLYLVFLI